MSRPTSQTRRLAVAAVLVIQTLFFFVWLPKPPSVVADNARYETAGYDLASGRGLTLPDSLQPDPIVRGWACSRHPESCTTEYWPTAIYAPGYQFYIASIYLVAGRSLRALVLSQLALLLGMFVVFERLAARFLRRAGYVFAMAVAATYPFLARQAGLVMSDLLHAALVLFAMGVLILRPAGWVRGLAGGALLAAATITRPYALFGLPLVGLGLAWADQSETAPRRSADRLGYCLGVFLPFVPWVARNALVFGKFIPFGTGGLGASLYFNKLEWTIGSMYQADHMREAYAELEQVAQGDYLSWAGNHRLQAAAIEWLLANPWKFVAALPLRAVRLWISLGSAGEGVSRGWPILVLYLGGLLLLGVAGMWLGRRQRELALLTLFILPYWAFLLHTPAEARRTLPLRLPLLIFAGLTVEVLTSAALRRRRGPLSLTTEESRAGDPLS